MQSVCICANVLGALLTTTQLLHTQATSLHLPSGYELLTLKSRWCGELRRLMCLKKDDLNDEGRIVLG